jgi:hypothetical protein
MRRLVIKPSAQHEISSVAEWISEKYFPETGLKFIDKLESFLLDYCQLTNLKFPLCRNKKLAIRKLSCVTFNRKWVIAFTFTQKKLIVRKFIWGPKLR